MEPLTVESAMQENTVTFEGHPADETIEAEEVTPEKVETPAEKVETPAEKVETPTFKYESQEAAEKAYREAESLIGKKADEAKRERERAEDLQKQLNESLLKVSAVPVEPAKSAELTTEEEVEKLLDEVNGFDSEAEGYYAKTAKSWAKILDKIKTNANTASVTAVKEAIDAFKEEQAKANDEVTMQKTIMSDAELAGKEAGLDMKKDSTDSDLFWAYADKAPEGSIEEQITWTIDKVKNIKAAYTPQLKSAEEVKANQEQNSVLERQGEGRQPDKKVPVTPLGLSDAFNQLQRRI